MALFLSNHAAAKIMILVQWSSDAFLVYICPQVLEWTNNMSLVMIWYNSFLNVAFYDVPAPSQWFHLLCAFYSKLVLRKSPKSEHIMSSKILRLSCVCA